MDKELTRFKAGRLKFAAVATACLIGVLALPAFASAAPFVSNYPAPGATLRIKPAVIYVDVVQANLAPTGTITVDGIPMATAVLKGTNGGYWTANETQVGGVYKVTWTWTVGVSAPKSTLRAVPAASALTTTTAPHVVVATIRTMAGATLSTTWNYTIMDNGVVVTPPVSGFDNLTCTTASTCHIHDAAGYATDNAMGPNCVGCHNGGYAPKHGLTPSAASMGTAHVALAAYIASSTSSACASCHGTTVTNVATRNTNGTVTTADDTFTVPAVAVLGLNQVAEHQGCSCHAFGEAKTMKACSNCHEGDYGVTHGWAPHAGLYNGEPAYTASGHNTPTYGTVGAHEKWNGSEGVVVKDSTNTTITQDWPLPTASVFWSQSNRGSLSPTDAPLVAMANRGFSSPAAGAAAINTTVGWNSVVTCQDCHSGLTGAGPQGANQVNTGLDPNFPDDWTKAEITSFDPTGMRKIDTVRDTANPYYTKLGANVYMPMDVEGASNPASPWAGMSIETTTRPVYGTGAQSTVKVMNGANVPGWSVATSATTISIKPGGFFGLTDTPSNGYSMGDSTGRFICQKCHKLTNSFQGLGIEGNGRGARDNNLNYMGMSNEAHMEHHNDMVTGQGNCVSCHIAIPHGWKRPRLLVYESDPAPYKVQYVWADYQSSNVATLTNMAPTNLLTSGNWGFLSNPTATTGSRYQDITATNAFTGGLNSTHLEKLDAQASALKELAVGPAEKFKNYDAANSGAFSALTGIGVNWGGWNMASEGVEWIGNPAAGATRINLTAWDGPTNSQVTIVDGDAAIQNNCNACTSASAGTHAPQVVGGVRTSTSNEGINPAVPYWK